MAKEGFAEDTIRTIERKTRRKYSAEEKIRIMLAGLRREESVAALCRREASPRVYTMPLSQSVKHRLE